MPHGLRLALSGPRPWFANLVTFGFLQDRMTKQYLLAARGAANDKKQGAISWRLD